MSDDWSAYPAAQQQGADPWAAYPVVQLNSALDRRSGAPLPVRAAVGAAVSPEDRLATLRKFYPDAQPYGEGNFVFRNPKTGQPVLYNEENQRVMGIPIPSVGDIASIGSEIGEMLGGVVGGAGALATAPATGGMGALAVPAGVGLGAAAGREMYNALAERVLGTQDTRSLPTQLSDVATTVGVNAVAERIPSLVGKGVRAVLGPADEKQATQALTDFSNLGVDVPSAGAVTGNRGTQITDNALSITPGGAGVYQQAAQKAIDQVKSASDDVAVRLATGDGSNPGGAVRTPQGVGETLKNAAAGAGQRFSDRRFELDDAVTSLIGPDTRVSVRNVQKLRNDLIRELEQAPESRKAVLGGTLRRVEQLLADAAPQTDEAGNVTRPEGIPFGALRKIRTDLGRELERPDVSGYNPAQAASIGELYGAIRGDIIQAAKDAGPDAERALRVHDRYVRFNRNVNLPTVQKVADQATDEQAFRFAMNMAKDGGTKLATLRRNMKPEEWDTVAGSVFQRLGQAKPGQAGATEIDEAVGDFSVNTFLTNWNALSPEARRALFRGTRYREIAPEMDALVRVVDRLKEAGKMANPSGTARNLFVPLALLETGNTALGDGSPGAGIAAGVVGGVIAPRMAAKLMTSPSFVRWLSQSGSLAMENPNTLPRQLTRLTAIAEAEPAIRDAVAQYISAVSTPPTPSAQQRPAKQ